MKDKILEALKLKFIGVSDATLERIAIKKAVSVKEESEVQILVDAMTVDTIIQSEIDFKITDANRKAVENYETKHGLKDGQPLVKKPAGKTKKDADTDEDSDPNAIQKMITDAVTAAITPLQQKIESQEKEKTKAALAGKALEKLKSQGVPDWYLEDRNLSVESEDQIEQLVSQVKTNYDKTNQKLVDQGIVISVPKSSIEGTKDGEKIGKEAADKKNKKASDGVTAKAL
jgi:hypothetical protein